MRNFSITLYARLYDQSKWNDANLRWVAWVEHAHPLNLHFEARYLGMIFLTSVWSKSPALVLFWNFVL